MTLEEAKLIGEIAVSLTVLIGGAVAIWKFRTFRVVSHKWSSSLATRDLTLSDGHAFVAEYTICNHGQRPLTLNQVTLALVPARREGVLLKPDESKPLAVRTVPDEDKRVAGNLEVHAGERSLFGLRALLSDLPEVCFVVCTIDVPGERVPSIFVRMHRQGQPTS